MLREKTLGSIVLVGALFATAACGDSSKSMNLTAPSAVAAASLNAEAGDANATSGATGNSNPKPKPVNPGNGNGNGNGPTPSTPTPPAPPPTNTSPVAPSVPTNPTTGKVEIEGVISALAGTSITVNGQTVAVPVGTVIRHGSRTVAYSALRIGDRVHITARMQGTVLEATEVKLQNSGGGDDGDDGDDDGDDDEAAGGGRVSVSVVDAAASETGTDTAAFRLTRVASATLPLTAPLPVTFTLTGTATNGTDYTTVPLSATFLAGQSAVDVTVVPLADALAESAESVILTLTSVAPYALGSSTSGTVTITDAASLPVVSVVAFDAAASETGPDLGMFRFTRTGSPASSLTVTYAVTGTAVNGTDYQAIPVTVAFLAGQATADVFVIPTADGIVEGVETVIVTLTDGATYDLGAPATATATVNIAG